MYNEWDLLFEFGWEDGGSRGVVDLGFGIRPYCLLKEWGTGWLAERKVV